MSEEEYYRVMELTSDITRLSGRFGWLSCELGKDAQEVKGIRAQLREALEAMESLGPTE